MMRVMGCDLSTKMGVAIVENSTKLLLANEYEFPGSKGLERCGELAQVVLNLREQYQPDCIVIEGYSLQSTNGLVYAVEIGTVLKFALWQRDIEYIDCPPSTLKKFVTGKGNANKEVVMLNVYKRWGIEAPTNNIADAVGLAMVGSCLLYPQAFTKQQAEAVKPLVCQLTVAK